LELHEEKGGKKGKEKGLVTLELFGWREKKREKKSNLQILPRTKPSNSARTTGCRTTRPGVKNKGEKGRL